MAEVPGLPEAPTVVSSHTGADPTGQRWVDGASHLRKVASWTLVVFATLGAGFVVSLPLVGLDGLTWPSARGGVAVAGAILLLGGLAMALWATVEVLLPRTGLLSELGEMEEQYTLERFELYGGLADTSTQLANRWSYVHDSLAAARLQAAAEAPEADGQSPGPWSRLVKVLEVEFAELDDAGTRAVRIGAYHKVEKVARWSRRTVIAAVALASLGTFLFYASVASNDDESEDEAAPAAGSAVPFSLPAEGELDLPDERLASLSELLPNGCRSGLDDGVRVVIVSGAGSDASPFMAAIPSSDTCPGYQFSVSASEVMVANQLDLAPAQAPDEDDWWPVFLGAYVAVALIAAAGVMAGTTRPFTTMSG